MAKYQKPGEKRSKAEIRKTKPDFKRWATKHFSPGSNQIPRTPFPGIGKKKPIICETCGKRVFELKKIYEPGACKYERCPDCVSKGKMEYVAPIEE